MKRAINSVGLECLPYKEEVGSSSLSSPTILGEMSEWLKVHAWNACLEETLSGVRISLSPRVSTKFFTEYLLYINLYHSLYEEQNFIYDHHNL